MVVLNVPTQRKTVHGERFRRYTQPLDISLLEFYERPSPQLFKMYYPPGVQEYQSLSACHREYRLTTQRSGRSIKKRINFTILLYFFSTTCSKRCSTCPAPSLHIVFYSGLNIQPSHKPRGTSSCYLWSYFPALQKNGNLSLRQSSLWQRLSGKVAASARPLSLLALPHQPVFASSNLARSHSPLPRLALATNFTWTDLYTCLGMSQYPTGGLREQYVLCQKPLRGVQLFSWK